MEHVAQGDTRPPGGTRDHCRSLDRLQFLGKEHFGRGSPKDALRDSPKDAPKDVWRTPGESVLEVLQARALEPTREEHNLINQSSDLAQLKTWLRRAATVARVSDLFA